MIRPATIEPSENLSDSALHSPSDAFAARHIGTSNPVLLKELLKTVGFDSLDALIDAAVPAGIRARKPLNLPAALSEFEALELLRSIADKNQVFRSHIGQGYYGTVTPPVILRNILENPGWYTAYTPYQAEISQGRMEALVNYQTMIVDLTKMEIANASLLDEGTAAAEAMHLAYAAKGSAERNKIFVSDQCYAQTIEVVRTRASALDIEVVVAEVAKFAWSGEYFAALVQYPAANGEICDYEAFARQAHEHGALLIVAADILALTLLRPPGEFGADVAVGCTQRFGVPMGFGGPHAAYMATREELKRLMPGRLIGVSKDSHGNPGYRLSLQTREQHIRRDKATSNICTAQVLLAVIASMYAVYHGPQGLRSIASRVVRCTRALASGLRELGRKVSPEVPFDTITVDLGETTSEEIAALAASFEINLRIIDGKTVGISLDETTRDLGDLFQVFNGGKPVSLDIESLFRKADAQFPNPHARSSDFLTHPVFRKYHSETELLRYLKRLENRDLTLTNSMIPLGSCTMKLNAAAEMIPVTWPEFGQIHPFAPSSQWEGYREMIQGLESWLAEITGLPSVSLQPNAGSQGEYAGLLLIHAWHAARKQTERDVCLIPLSAHGTNPASAVMAGFRVVPVTCDKDGNIDIGNLKLKLEENAGRVGALMVTYPSTHGVFETTISEICSLVHEAGALVYMDGANMNAQVGLCRPGDIGVDVCHLNLHKTFCIPHGGGGPGVGPIAASAELGRFLPGHPAFAMGGEEAIGPVSAAPWGSASILVISWMYIAMMGPDGLTHATKMAILNANYIAGRLADSFPVLYRGNKGLVAHECILDVREWKQRAGVEVEDIAKRLMDYGFHAPTMSWPVPGTLMVEPTECESKAELDRFCDAMLSIHAELLAIESGKLDRKDNPLKNAPHTAVAVTADQWTHAYSREQAAFPAAWVREAKYWPPVGRVDNVYGDRNLYCTCVPMDA